MKDTSEENNDSRCPMCGKEVTKRPRCNKLRFRHKCPHGKWCGQGDRLVGGHTFAPRHSPNCSECRALSDNAFQAERSQDVLTTDEMNLKSLWKAHEAAIAGLREYLAKTGSTIQVDITIRDAAASERYAKRMAKKRK